uniref:Uncharacterized protein n=1 Tax=Cannabis sativa TaxID=3483 RepID=A0A803Q2M8_CANSA
MRKILKKIVIANSRFIDELASLQEGLNKIHGFGRHLQGVGTTAAIGGSRFNGRIIGVGFSGRNIGASLNERNIKAGKHRIKFQAQKIELHVFTSNDPNECTYQAKRYLGLQRLSSMKQLEEVVLCLEGGL